MFRSRLFWKLFLGLTAVNLLSAIALLQVTWQWQHQRARELADQELRSATALLAELAPPWFEAPLSPEATDRLRKVAAAVGGEVTLADAKGKTVYRVAPLGSAAAIASHTRRVPAPGAVVNGDPPLLGTVRVARSVERLEEEFAELRRLYVLFGLVGSLLLIGIGYGLVRHVVGPVRELNDAALAMAGGEYRQRAFVSNRDELGTLARSFNRMSQELGDQLSELRESDRRQATVLGGMIEGVIAIDARQRVLFANDAAGRLFGFLPPQAEGRPLLEAVRNHLLHDAVGKAIESRVPERLDIEWQDRQLSVQVSPLLGEPTGGAVVVLHDTTELRRLEGMRRDFVANVSHELKTPLASIKAYAETLITGAESMDSATRTKFLGRIEEQADRLAELVQDMLNLARIESAREVFDIKPVPVLPAVEACLRAYQPRAEAKQIRLGPDADHDRLQVRADPEGLRVILGNLVDNAIKYTPDGGQVQVRWRPDGAMVRIDVVDTGIGIPEGKLGRVFERFYRVDEARTREAGGTGLGLAIVKHLAQSFGGGVSVESSTGRGATFSVTLPAA
ncbi:MAG: HAMP domain-containing sensor histidine kinase [Lacipirellulaceae bacterium]